MKHKLYLQLLADGRWARKGMYVAKSARTLRFDVELEEKTGRDYTDLVEKTFLCFSLCTSPNIGRGADQCFDRIVTAYRDRVPKDKLADFDHLYRLWRDYHLNDMTAGTKKQEDFLRQNIQRGEYKYENATSLSEATGITIFICNRDEVIAVSGASKRDYLDKRVSDKMATIMDERNFFSNKKGSSRVFVVDDNPFYIQCAMPIIADGEVMGCVIAGVTDSGDDAKVSAEAVETLVKTSAKLLGKQATSIW